MGATFSYDAGCYDISETLYTQNSAGWLPAVHGAQSVQECESAMGQAFTQSGGTLLTQWEDASMTSLTCKAAPLMDNGLAASMLGMQPTNSCSRKDATNPASDLAGSAGGSSYGVKSITAQVAPYPTFKSTMYTDLSGNNSTFPHVLLTDVSDGKLTVDPNQLFSAGNPKAFSGLGQLSVDYSWGSASENKVMGKDGDTLQFTVDSSLAGSINQPFNLQGFKEMPPVESSVAYLNYLSQRYAQALALIDIMPSGDPSLPAVKQSALRLNASLQSAVAGVGKDAASTNGTLQSKEAALLAELAKLQEEQRTFKANTDAKAAAQAILRSRQADIQKQQTIYKVGIGGLAAGALAALVLAFI